MQVMDIVNRAAMNCGVASSFNPGEVPEDIQARGSDILRHEIIPALNCDRTIDITEVVYPAKPDKCAIVLRTPPDDYPKVIIGQVPEKYQDLKKKTKWMYMGSEGWVYSGIAVLLERLGYMGKMTYPWVSIDRTDKWPKNQFGNYLKLAVWTSDFKLVDVTDYVAMTGDDDDALLDPNYNLPFAPMRVTAVVRAEDGATFQYLHAEEMVSAEFKWAQLVYRVEDLPDCMVIRFNEAFGDFPVTLVLPVPLKIVNSVEEENPWGGTIIAPEKFRSFLIAKLAYRLAVEYGLETAGVMERLVTEAYSALVKNLSKQQHSQDIPRKIFTYLERQRGWRAGANGSGYVGGFNG